MTKRTQYMEFENGKIWPVKCGSITAPVEIKLHDVVHSDYETFLDALSRKVTGTELLEDIGYTIVGATGQTLTLCVEGRIEALLNVQGEYPRVVKAKGAYVTIRQAARDGSWLDCELDHARNTRGIAY